MKKMKNQKGFTLMEMLIVVAIIAILIAIAIPTFNSSLNKAKVATDEANIRSGYASVMAEILASDTDIPTGGASYTLNVDGSVTAVTPDASTTSGNSYETKGDATKVVTGKVSIGGIEVDPWGVGHNVTYTVNTADGGYNIAIAVN